MAPAGMKRDSWSMADMICPRCDTEFEGPRSVCPECGVRLARNISGVIRTSAVLISAGREGGVYRSVQEVPEPLRTQLILTTASQNSGTIVIADRAGKEQLTKVLAHRQNKAGARARKAEQTMSAEEAALLDELLANIALSAETLSQGNVTGEATTTQAFARERAPSEDSREASQPGELSAGDTARDRSALDVFGQRASWLAWAGMILVLLLAAVVSLLFGMRW